MWVATNDGKEKGFFFDRLQFLKSYALDNTNTRDVISDNRVADIEERKETGKRNFGGIDLV